MRRGRQAPRLSAPSPGPFVPPPPPPQPLVSGPGLGTEGAVWVVVTYDCDYLSAFNFRFLLQPDYWKVAFFFLKVAVLWANKSAPDWKLASYYLNIANVFRVSDDISKTVRRHLKLCKCIFLAVFCSRGQHCHTNLFYPLVSVLNLYRRESFERRFCFLWFKPMKQGQSDHQRPQRDPGLARCPHASPSPETVSLPRVPSCPEKQVALALLPLCCEIQHHRFRRQRGPVA